MFSPSRALPTLVQVSRASSSSLRSSQGLTGLQGAWSWPAVCQRNHIYGNMKGLQDALKPRAIAQSQTQAMEQEHSSREETIVTWVDLIHRPEVDPRK
eukprot:733042-Hanusia_phi.AAC.1